VPLTNKLIDVTAKLGDPIAIEEAGFKQVLKVNWPF
jgi:hypothetical protein